MCAYACACENLVFIFHSFYISRLDTPVNGPNVGRENDTKATNNSYNDNSYNNSFEKKQPMAHYNVPHIQSDLLPCNSCTDDACFPDRRRSNGAGVVPVRLHVLDVRHVRRHHVRDRAVLQDCEGGLLELLFRHRTRDEQ